MSLQNKAFRPLFRKLATAIGVGAGDHGHIEIVGGSTIHEIELQTNITDPAQLTKVTLEIDDVPVASLSGTWLKELEKRKGRFNTDGIYKLAFSDFNYRTREGVRSSELVTFAHESIFLKFEIAEKGANATFTDAPTVKGRMAITEGKPVRAFIPRIYETTYDASSSGVNEMMWKNGSPTKRIRRLHFRTPHITDIKIWRNTRLEHEETRDEMTRDSKEHGFTPIADVFTFDPTKFGFGWDGLFPTHGAEFKFELNYAQAQSTKILVEMLEQTAPLN